MAEASILEEPGAGKPHARIRAGAVGQLAVVRPVRSKPHQVMRADERKSFQVSRFGLLTENFYNCVSMQVR